MIIPKGFDLSNWKDVVTINCDGENRQVCEEDQEVILGHALIKKPVRYPVLMLIDIGCNICSSENSLGWRNKFGSHGYI